MAKGVKHHCKPCGKARWGKIEPVSKGKYKFTATECSHVTKLEITENGKFKVSGQ